MPLPLEKVALACLLIASCDRKPEAGEEHPAAEDAEAAAAQHLYTRDALEDEAWCMALQKRPGLAKHLGEATFTDAKSIKPAKDQCAYFGEDGSLEMGIVAVAESSAVAAVLFDTLTAGPPATREAIAALRPERLETFGKRLDDVSPKDPGTAQTQLENMVSQTLYVGKSYEDVEGIADQAAIQTQHSKALGFALRYLYLREGNAILMFLTRPQGELAPWEDAYRRLRGALPDVLDHVRGTQGG